MPVEKPGSPISPPAWNPCWPSGYRLEFQHDLSEEPDCPDTSFHYFVDRHRRPTPIRQTCYDLVVHNDVARYDSIDQSGVKVGKGESIFRIVLTERLLARARRLLCREPEDLNIVGVLDDEALSA